MKKADALNRPNPGSGDRISTYKFDDPVDGGTIQAEHITSAPMNWLPITPAAGVNTVLDYPYDGATPQPQSPFNTTTLKLAADGPAFDITSHLVLLNAGTGAGQVRRIASYASLVCTLEGARPWIVTPDSTTRYTVLVEAWLASLVHLKSEFDTIGAANFAGVIPVLYSIALAADWATFEKSERFNLPEVTVDNYSFVATDGTIANFYQGRGHSFGCGGALGAKFRLSAPPASGKIWMAACGT